MIILVYAAQTEKTIAANIGQQDYSYYFVLESFKKVLRQFGTLVDVRNPQIEVDATYNACKSRNEPCVFLSFTPPFKIATGLRCPTIPVFAWEFETIPTDVWGGDQRQDWRNVFSHLGVAITHSAFAVSVVQKAMGSDFPIWSIPSPLWDDYVKLSQRGGKAPGSGAFDLTFHGAFVDFQGCTGPRPGENDGNSFTERRSSTEEAQNLHLEGIIYTAVFNPLDGRKNWMDLLWGFCWALRDEPKATLVLKLVHHDWERVRSIFLREIRKLGPFKCRVVVIHGFLSDGEYKKLIQKTAYVVNTSHGEGQCLPLMEFMSAGVPAIAPAHTAMREYVHPDNAFVVKSSVEWTHWPHDPRLALRTLRQRIDWESLHAAYRESCHVARNDPERYSRMSCSAVERLEGYCSEGVVEKRLQAVFRWRLAPRGRSFLSEVKNALRAPQNFWAFLKKPSCSN